MSYFLASEEGALEDFASIQGLRAFRAWAIEQNAPTLRAFLDVGYTDDLDDLRLELSALMSSDPEVTESLDAMRTSAVQAKEVLILSTGEESPDEDDTAQLLGLMEDAIRAGDIEVIEEMLGMRIAGGPGSGNFGHAGRPGEVGGSAEGGGGGKTEHILKDPNERRNKNAKGVEHYLKTSPNPGGTDTQKQYVVQKGDKKAGIPNVYTPEREKLHEEIIHHFLQQQRAVDNPHALVLGGGPASGKSTLEKTLPSENITKVNSDDIREFLPEYHPTPGIENESAAITHEEASDINAKLMARALEARHNMTLDGTGDGSMDGLTRKINQMRSTGHSVSGEYVSLPTDMAYNLMLDRGKKSGRYVPENVLRETHAEVSRIFPQAVQDRLFDTANLHDTEIFGSMRAVLSQDRAGKVTIHNQALWETFLAKGGPENVAKWKNAFK